MMVNHPPVSVRRVGRLLRLLLISVVISGAPWVAAGPSPVAAATFSDISASKFQGDIEWLAASGITSGCGGGKFCPTGIVTRGQMASFLSRFLALPATTADYFADDETNRHELNINRLAAAGITGGCAAGRFCPNGTVTRAQMASFLTRGVRLTIGGAVDLFDDDDRNSHTVNIERLAVAGITSGCATRRFCPDGAVLREQMAAFLHRSSAFMAAPNIAGDAGSTATLRTPAGPVTGYIYAPDFGAATASARVIFNVPTNLVANRTAMINGVRHYRVRGSGFVDHWIPVVGATPIRTGRPLPGCAVADVLTAHRTYGDWQRTLLDWTLMIPRSYAPPDLVPAANAGVRYGAYGTVHVRSLVTADLSALNTAARNAGHGNLKVNSAYRSFDTQAEWFASYVASKGYNAALMYSNRAGHSAHQLGTTLDIDVYATAGLNSWMKANAHSYGFVQSFTAARASKHCYAVEDWHYRYVGRGVAAQIRASGLTEREWLWYTKHQ